jgi:hypothetical protein
MIEHRKLVSTVLLNFYNSTYMYSFTYKNEFVYIRDNFLCVTLQRCNKMKKKNVKLQNITTPVSAHLAELFF